MENLADKLQWNIDSTAKEFMHGNFSCLVTVAPPIKDPPSKDEMFGLYDLFGGSTVFSASSLRKIWAWKPN